MTVRNSIWIGFDPREASAFAVAYKSITRRLRTHVPIHGIVLDHVRRDGFYWRSTETRENAKGHLQLWDVRSGWWMSTEFAISRFLVPHLVRDYYGKTQGDEWALFMDCDMLVKDDLSRLFAQADPTKAVMVVKHRHKAEGFKMDDQVQSPYHRKNWSSVVLWNVNHPANDPLTLEVVNTLSGRDLHRFCWLQDEYIGELTPHWNYLAGHTHVEGYPKIVHFTDGIPQMPGYENGEYADEWQHELREWGCRPV